MERTIEEKKIDYSQKVGICNIGADGRTPIATTINGYKLLYTINDYISNNLLKDEGREYDKDKKTNIIGSLWLNNGEYGTYWSGALNIRPFIASYKRAVNNDSKQKYITDVEFQWTNDGSRIMIKLPKDTEGEYESPERDLNIDDNFSLDDLPI